MNAAPLSVNAAAGNYASSGASAEAAKASALPAFAQVMAEKQAAVSAPKESVERAAVETKGAKSQSTPRVAEKAADSAPVNPKSSASGVAIAPKKSDASGKNANDTSGSKSAAQNPVPAGAQVSGQVAVQVAVQVAAQISPQVAAQVPAIHPGLNGTMPRMAAADLASAAPTSNTTGNSASIDHPATKAGGTSVAAAGAATTNLAAAQPQVPATSELPSPIAGDSQNLPMSPANAPQVSATATAAATNYASATEPVAATRPGEGQNDWHTAAPVEIAKLANVASVAGGANAENMAGTAQSLPVAGNDSTAQNAAGNSGSAAGNQAPVATSEPKAQDLSAAAAVLPAGTAGPGTDPGAAKAEAAPKIQAKRNVQEILRGAAVLSGKEAQAAAQVSVSAAKDAVSAIKGKSAASDNTAPIAAEPAVNAKNETPASVKAERVTPEVVVTPDKPESAKSGSNLKGNSSTDASASGNNSSAGAALNVKDFVAGVDPNAAHSAMPAGQSDPNNLAGSSANGVPAPSATSGKDAGSAMAVKAGDASKSDAPAPADVDDMAAQPNVSHAVNVAQLTGSESHSQVRIAMQADQLGQVELHATVHGQLVGAAITVEKKEAHAAMVAEMPSLQQALETRQFRVGEVVLMQGALHSTAGDAGNAAMEQQRRGQAGTTYQQVENETTYEAGAGTSFEGSGIFDDAGRLSVRA